MSTQTDKMLYIVGPCSLENHFVAHGVLAKVLDTMKGKNWYFKGSFDKANRTNIEGSRGPGLEYGKHVFKRLKKDFPKVKFITDVHETWQVQELVGVVDAIQIPAFLCKQTDLIVEAAKYFDKINIKKGQWVSPKTIVGAISKVRSVNPNAEIWVTERGMQVGYGHLVVDFASVEYLKQHFDKVIFDVTHSTQRVNEDGRNGGDYKMAKKYFKAAPIFGYNGIFCETHFQPERAISDQDSMIPTDEFIELMKEVNEKSNS